MCGLVSGLRFGFGIRGGGVRFRPGKELFHFAMLGFESGGGGLHFVSGESVIVERGLIVVEIREGFGVGESGQ